MAVTLFLTNTNSSTTIPSTPSGYWETTNANVRTMEPNWAGDANASSSTTKSTSGAADVMNRRWVSLPFERSATLTGGYTMVIPISCTTAANTATARARLIVLRADGTTQVIIDSFTNTGAWSTTVTARSMGATAVDTDLSVFAGDSLILEFGFNSTASATGGSGAIRVGGSSAAPLLAANATGTTTTSKCSYLILSDSVWDDLWTPPPPDPGVPQPITAVGSLLENSGPATTISLNPTAIGNLFPLAMFLGYNSPGRTISSITGGNCTWTKIGSTSRNNNMNGVFEFWYGVSTSTGASTATIGTTGTGVLSGNSIAVRQFTSGLGADAVWRVVDSSILDQPTPDNDLIFPTLTADATNELYVGHIVPAFNGNQPSDSGGWVWATDDWTSLYVYKLNTGGSGSVAAPSATQDQNDENAVGAAIFSASLPVLGPPPGRMLLGY